MDYRCITCEPNYITSNDVSIAKLQEEEKNIEAQKYPVAPVRDINASRTELIETFSLRTNDYLSCKWKQFLNQVPENVLMVKSYKEYKRKKSPVRKKILTGKYYQDSGNLIPVPHMPGQR